METMKEKVQKMTKVEIITSVNLATASASTIFHPFVLFPVCSYRNASINSMNLHVFI
jgi:hypothetical protein